MRSATRSPLARLATTTQEELVSSALLNGVMRTPDFLHSFTQHMFEWSRGRTRTASGLKLSASGSVHSGMGNSGDEVRLVVMKRGLSPERVVLLLDQAKYCMALGSIAPTILGTTSDGYAMEVLEEEEMTPFTPGAVLWDLEHIVWPRPPLYLRGRRDWCPLLAEFLGVESIPDWVASEQECLIHGDPTLANVMRRERELVLIDPLPPMGKTPSLRSIDRAAVMQSMCGWELLLGMEPRTTYLFPQEISMLTELEMQRVLFWLMVKARRILPYTSDPLVVDWCHLVERSMHEVVSL